uniref:G domain-containing protein n=1 Tax=Amphimedon queenslandica TaxID=400682 RepID=A0A1X7VSY5_AMPQE
MAEKQEDSDDVTNVPGPNEDRPEDPTPRGPIICDKTKTHLQQLQKPVHILFAGLAGAGKSTLVNTTLGKVVAPVVSGPNSTEVSKNYYEGEFEGVQLKVYDTNDYNKSNEEIPESNRFDLIFVCIKITNRLSDSEEKFLQALGKELDKEAWKRTVIVLTFANLLVQDPTIKYMPTEKEKHEAINDIKEEYEKCIRKLLEGHMDKETAHSIPFCLAGESNPHDLSDRSVRKLPTTEDWLVDLWKTVKTFPVHSNPEIKIKPWFDRFIEYLLKMLSQVCRFCKSVWKCDCESLLIGGTVN